MVFKSYKTIELEAALNHLHSLSEPNPVLDDFSGLVQAEVQRRNLPPFIKATDEYIDSLDLDAVYIRMMKPTDAYYIRGMYGLFLKDGDRLLRRHTDTGLLRRPRKTPKVR